MLKLQIGIRFWIEPKSDQHLHSNHQSQRGRRSFHQRGVRTEKRRDREERLPGVRRDGTCIWQEELVLAVLPFPCGWTSNHRPALPPNELVPNRLELLEDCMEDYRSHIKSMTKSAFFHLKNISRLRPSLSDSVTETLIHAFITSRLDYCNGVLFGVPSKALDRLQYVQNSAARVLTRTKPWQHITPTLIRLHWLPYLSDLLHHQTPSRRLRSSDTGLLSTPRTSRRTFGDRAYSVAAPTLWNSLPIEIRQAPTLDSFKAALKTHLLCLVSGGTVVQWIALSPHSKKVLGSNPGQGAFLCGVCMFSSCLPACAIKPLQLVQNAAARLVFNQPKFTHVTLYSPLCTGSPIAARIRFKPLRSASAGRLTAPSLRAPGSRSSRSRLFSVLVPRWWNDLPQLVRTAESLPIFRKRLKTHLFRLHYPLISTEFAPTHILRLPYVLHSRPKPAPPPPGADSQTPPPIGADDQGRSHFYHLLLHGNSLSRLFPNEFANFYNAVSLHLESNGLHDIVPGAFLGLQLVKRLHVNNNKIRSFKKNTFLGLDDLEYLQADFNLLRDVDPSVFRDLNKLEVLILNDNLISSLPDDLFQHVPVTHLDLRGNRIKTLAYEGLLEQIPGVVEVLLDDNPWECGCSLSSLKEWLENVVPRGALIGRVVCEAPARLQGRDLNETSEAELCPRGGGGGVDESLAAPPTRSSSSDSDNDDPTTTKGAKKTPNRPESSSSSSSSTTPGGEDEEEEEDEEGEPPAEAITPDARSLRVDCKGRKIDNLHGLKPKAAANVHELNLRDNNIHTVRKSHFAGHPDLTLLDLGGNNIKLIENSTFQNLTRLQWLYMDKNYLDSLTMEMFVGLHNLEYLSLEYNDIQQVAARAFDPMPNLRVLFLNNNLLKSLPADVFLGVSLLRISLHNNYFTFLPVAGVLDQLPALWTERLGADVVVSDLRCESPEEFWKKDFRLLANDVMCPSLYARTPPTLVSSSKNDTAAGAGFPGDYLGGTHSNSYLEPNRVSISVLVPGLLLVFVTSAFTVVGMLVFILRNRKRSKRRDGCHATAAAAAAAEISALQTVCGDAASSSSGGGVVVLARRAVSSRGRRGWWGEEVEVGTEGTSASEEEEGRWGGWGDDNAPIHRGFRCAREVCARMPRKPEYPEETHADTGEHANSTQKGPLAWIRTETFLLERPVGFPPPSLGRTANRRPPMVLPARADSGKTGNRTPVSVEGLAVLSVFISNRIAEIYHRANISLARASVY
ncbi:hypothetical protein AAFF_G00294270 [Aldrovandia affinis]|uniref:LRRCT domain-containing protein n=1 Tax=Aldrovandia affinis TaxID=143900 RepID=A0AAD7R955_9TELE|nr:hypothetical protein AAFF_G00294270 [Aldrovandia affinis]